MRYLKKILILNLKSFSNTKWEKRVISIKLLKIKVRQIYQALLAKTSNDTKDSNVYAYNSTLKIYTYKFICFIIIWHDILYIVNVACKMMKNQKLDLEIVSQNLEILLKD